MADLNPTGRFSSRVEDYLRYRPSYPAEIVPLLERDCALSANSTVADIGSGTGLLTRLFLELGCHVFGVEPNADMRRAGEAFLAHYEKFTSVDGQAERTGLPDASVDLAAAGQAFHWFDATAARREFRRVLRPPKNVVLIWNERVVEGAFLRGYEDLMLRYARDYSKVDHRHVDAARMSGFFGHGRWKMATFPNLQQFDLEGLRGRVHSSSYAPRPGETGYAPMMSALEQLFERHQDRGRVDFVYQTKMYYGEL